MRFSRLLSLSPLASLLLLTSCGHLGTKTDPTAGRGGLTGPFDKRGNYHEEWADDPSKWGGSHPSAPVGGPGPMIASNNKPLPDPRTIVSGGGGGGESEAVSRPSRPTRGNEVEVANRETAKNRQKLAIVKPREPEPAARSKVPVSPKGKASADREKTSEKARPSSDKGKSNDKPKSASDKGKSTDKPKSSTDKGKSTDKPKSSGDKPKSSSSDKPKPKSSTTTDKPKSSSDKPKSSSSSSSGDKPKPKPKSTDKSKN